MKNITESQTSIKTFAVDSEVLVNDKSYDELVEELPIVTMEQFRTGKNLPDKFILQNEVEEIGASGTHTVAQKIATRMERRKYVGIHPDTYIRRYTDEYHVVGGGRKHMLAVNLGWGPFSVSVGGLTPGTTSSRVPADINRPSRIGMYPDLLVSTYKIETRLNSNNQVVSTRYDNATVVFAERFEAVYD